MNKMKKLFLIINVGFFLLGGLSFSYASNAAQNFGADLITINDRPADVIDNDDIRQVAIGIINYFLGFSGLLAVVVIIYAAILMLTAGGDQGNVDKGKKIMMWAAAGLILIMLSYTVVRFITNAGQNI